MVILSHHLLIIYKQLLLIIKKLHTNLSNNSINKYYPPNNFFDWFLLSRLFLLQKTTLLFINLLLLILFYYIYIIAINHIWFLVFYDYLLRIISNLTLYYKQINIIIIFSHEFHCLLLSYQIIHHKNVRNIAFFACKTINRSQLWYNWNC
jgi:hypothetical protein